MRALDSQRAQERLRVVGELLERVSRALGRVGPTVATRVVGEHPPARVSAFSWGSHIARVVASEWLNVTTGASAGPSRV